MGAKKGKKGLDANQRSILAMEARFSRFERRGGVVQDCCDIRLIAPDAKGPEATAFRQRLNAAFESALEHARSEVPADNPSAE